MIVVAGGLFDTNLTVLLERLRRRSLPHREIRTGPEGGPGLRIDLEADSLELAGEVLSPSAMFVRQDVFLYPTPDLATAHTAASNWYGAVRGWALGHPEIRMFNRHTSLRENNKIQNLMEARRAGLSVPATIVTTTLPDVADAGEWIAKPAAGGAYTMLLKELDGVAGENAYPRFVQPRLHRPEMRIYRIGRQMMAFRLESPELDYRSTQDVSLSEACVPSELGAGLLRLCDRLELEFAAADFMADADGALHFLEVNTQPMFAAFDRVVDGRLADAIIDALMSPARGSLDDRAPA